MIENLPTLIVLLMKKGVAIAVLQSRLKRWLKYTVWHAIPVPVLDTVLWDAVLVRDEHHIDLNKVMKCFTHFAKETHLITLVTSSVLRAKLAQGIVWCPGETRRDLHICVCARLGFLRLWLDSGTELMMPTCSFIRPELRIGLSPWWLTTMNTPEPFAGT